MAYGDHIYVDRGWYTHDGIDLGALKHRGIPLDQVCDVREIRLLQLLKIHEE